MEIEEHPPALPRYTTPTPGASVNVHFTLYSQTCEQSCNQLYDATFATPRGAALPRLAMPRAAPADTGLEPWPDAEVTASLVYKILTQFSTPKDVTCTVSNSPWPNVAGLQSEIKGTILQWQNRQR